jgi:hypothetical protein
MIGGDATVSVTSLVDVQLVASVAVKVYVVVTAGKAKDGTVTTTSAPVPGIAGPSGGLVVYKTPVCVPTIVRFKGCGLPEQMTGFAGLTAGALGNGFTVTVTTSVSVQPPVVPVTV